MGRLEQSIKQKNLPAVALSYRTPARQIVGLRSVTITQDPWKGKRKLTPIQKKGLAYEKNVAGALCEWKARGELVGDIYISPWFKFQDANGVGCCCPDILVATPELVFILECKLTYTDWAWQQLRSLYKPVVEKFSGRPALTIQVCKHLVYEPSVLIESLMELIDNPRDGLLTWHFIP